MESEAQTKTYFEGNYEKMFGSPRDVRFAVYDEEIWEDCVKHLKRAEVVADFGSGGGTLLYNVAKVSDAKLIGIEQAESAQRQTRDLVPRVEILSEDVLNTSLRSSSVDFSLSTMTIEHVDDKKFVAEVYRVLKTGGYFFVTSVVKTDFAWYFYKNAAGETVLEPSHLREYKSLAEFENVLKSCGFSIIKSKLPPIRFPLVDPFLKAVTRLTKIKNLLTIKPIEILRLMTRIPIPGYYAVEVLAQKK